MYDIVAEIEGGFGDPDVICSFDPTKVIARLQKAFPEIVVASKDYAWRDYDTFRSTMGLTDESGALGVAARDARRRGPVWLFRLPVEGVEPIRGKAERHFVGFHSEVPFPEPLRTRLIQFTENLRFAPCVITKCVRCGDNDEYPA